MHLEHGVEVGARGVGEREVVRRRLRGDGQAAPLGVAGANALTALLAVIANLLYVFAYTPFKQHSAYALHVGAILGAIPLPG